MRSSQTPENSIVDGFKQIITSPRRKSIDYGPKKILGNTGCLRWNVIRGYENL
jgi:hypothetical protein